MRSAVVISQRSSGRLVRWTSTKNHRLEITAIAPAPWLVNEPTVVAAESQSVAAQAKPLTPDPVKQLQIKPDRLGYAHVQWDIAESHRQALRTQGGKQMMLRIQDVTNVGQPDDIPLSIQTYICGERDREKYVAIPVLDHDYIAELGYFTEDYRWLSLHQSDVVRISAM